MGEQGRIARVVLLGSAASLLLLSGCRRDIKSERVALYKEAKAIEARHMALDDEIASWSENVGRWIKDNAVTIDPARVVLSLSSRSFSLHESQHPGAAAQDSGYGRLEDQMKDIQAKRKAIEADWLDLISRDEASIKRAGIKTTMKQSSFDFELGDSTIPIPGVSARQRCCPLVSGGCKLTGEHCESGPNKTWHLVCEYICDPIILDLGILARKAPG